jgi:HAD superfamily hydrolase (TIGR01549 family)
MIKTILFDFDGVIVESVDIKTEAFRDLFKMEKSESLDQILEYHKIHGGIDRKNKIIYFYKNILKRELSDKKLEELINKFSILVKDKVIHAEYVKGAKAFIENNYKKYNCYIVTGTPQNEIDEIIEKRRLKPYFKKIYGYPPGKTKLIKKIILDIGENKKNMVFIGDSIDDLKGAIETGVRFIGRLIVGKKNREFKKGNFPLIADFEGIEDVISTL